MSTQTARPPLPTPFPHPPSAFPHPPDRHQHTVADEDQAHAVLHAESPSVGCGSVAHPGE